MTPDTLMVGPMRVFGRHDIDFPPFISARGVYAQLLVRQVSHLALGVWVQSVWLTK